MLKKFTAVTALFAMTAALFINQSAAQTITPLHYWTFNSASALADSVSAQNLDMSTYSCGYTLNNAGLVGKYITLGATGNNIGAGTFAPDSTMAIEFLFRPGYQFNTTRFFRRVDGAMSAYFTYPYLEFTTTVKLTNGSTVTDVLKVDLNGTGRKQYGYYTDGNWHHIVFKHNAASGQKQIWVDGQCPQGFSKTSQTGVFNNPNGSNKTLLFNQQVTYEKLHGDIDEIAMYTRDVPDKFIYKHFLEAFAGLPYSFLNNYPSSVPPASSVSGPIDINEYAPGHPSYTVQAFDQLKAFPLARYKPGHTLMNNFNWMDPVYFGGRFQPGVSDAQAVTNSTNINLELAKNWNYYISLKWGLDNFGNAWVNLANQNPQLKAALITFRAQLNPAELITSQNLSASHYLQNSSGQFLNGSGSVVTSGKVWRPSAPPADYNQDGLTAKSWVNNVVSNLTRPLDIINENGEVFTLLSSSAMSQDPQVTADKNASGLDWATYQGRRFKENETQSYKNHIMSIPGLSNTLFTEYAIDGQPTWRQKYSEARLVNSQINGQYYSTGDFYPRWPYNWRMWTSAWHGWQWIVESRVNELAVGDNLYSPYVAAGWDVNEENNIRPAQWLGLLKCLGVTGADFYYTGFFNTGSPYADPRGYAWQAAMPVYSQAVTSRYEDVLKSGQLLEGDVPNSWTNPTGPGYSFWAGDYRKLVVARKHNSKNKYAITGTIQPNSNMLGNAELEGNAQINLNGQTLKFKIRRQGSTYVYDNTIPSAPVFYQLDEWHEPTHPYYWTKDFNFEAELFDNTSTTYKLKTTTPAGTTAGDYTNFTTCISFDDTATVFTPIEYEFIPRGTANQTYYFWVRARTRTAGAVSGMNVSMDNTNIKVMGCINDTNFTWLRFEACTQAPISFSNLAANTKHTLRLKPETNKVEIDKIVLTTNAALVLNPALPSCASTTASITPNGPTTFCQGSNVVLTANNGTSYLWSPGGQTTQSITVSSSGTHSVTVGTGGGCNAVSSPVTVTVVNPSASITPNGPTTFCTGGSVVLTANNGSSYQWSSGATTQSITVSNSGTFTVTVTNQQGCSKVSSPVSVTVQAATQATITAGGSTTICPGSSVTLTANTGTNYLWSNGQSSKSINVSSAGNYVVTVTYSGGCTSVSSPVQVSLSSVNQPTVTANGPTTFCPGGSVQLTSSTANAYLWTNGATTKSITVSSSGNFAVQTTNAAGCTSMSAPTTVTVSNNITASVTANGPTSFCSGNSVMLTANSATSYLWSNGATTQSISVSSTGNFAVTVSNGSGCSATSSSVAVTVFQPQPSSITASGATNFCQGGNVTLTANGGSSYLWSNGSVSQSITVNASGNYSAQVTDANGCTSNVTQTVTVYALPVVPIYTLGNTSLMPGQTVTFTTNAAASYQWSNGATTQAITVSSAGTYFVTAFNTYGCSAASASVQVTVVNIPATSITPGGSTTLCDGQTVTLTSSPGVSYLWQPGGETTQTITVSEEGNYSVTVFDGAGNPVGTASEFITVIPAPSVPSIQISYVVNSAYQLTAYEPSAVSYVWSNGQTNQAITVTAPASFTVKAVNAFGCMSPSASMTVTSMTTQSCVAVNMLTAHNITDTSATLSWNPAITANSFVVTYKNLNTGMQATVNAGGNVSSVHVGSLSPGDTYQWSVASVCGANSQMSASAQFTLLTGMMDCGSTPQNTFTKNIYPTTARATWYPVTANQFIVRIKKTGTANWMFKYYNGTTNASGGMMGNLLPLTTYEWEVRSLCSGVYSAWSDVNVFTTPDVCPEAGIVSAPDYTQTSVKLVWSNASPVDSIRIKYHKVGSPFYTRIDIDGNPNPGTYVIHGLKANTTYVFYVKSICTGGIHSDPSDSIIVTTLPSGEFTISENDNDPIKLNAFPNPVQSELSYAFISEEETDYQVRICDLSGRILFSDQRQAAEGGNYDRLDVSRMAKGMYLLIIDKKAIESRFKFSVN